MTQHGSASQLDAAAQWCQMEPRPLVVFPRTKSHASVECSAALTRCAERYLPQLGSILFRGFELDDARAFERFVRAFELCPIQNEPTAHGSRLLCVGCLQAPDPRCTTLIANIRQVYGELPNRVRTRLAECELRGAALPALFDYALSQLQPSCTIPEHCGAGPALEPSVIRELQEALLDCAATIDWRPRDLLLIDRRISYLHVPSPLVPDLLYAAEG